MAKLLIGTLFTASLATAGASVPKNDLFFVETFDEADPFSSSGNWVKSSNERYSEQVVTIKSANSPAKGFESDKGLQLTSDHKFYGFGSKFKTPPDTKDKKEIVIQYELKLEETLACGGAYIKLPRSIDNFDMAT